MVYAYKNRIQSSGNLKNYKTFIHKNKQIIQIVFNIIFLYILCIKYQPNKYKHKNINHI